MRGEDAGRQVRGCTKLAKEVKLDWDEFRDWSHRAADWGADYRSSLRDRPVRANTVPGEIAAQIAASPPERSSALLARTAPARPRSSA